MYQVEVTYVSVTPRMGMQFAIGETKAKGYLPQTGSMEREKTVVLDRIYVADTLTYPVSALSGDDSNGDTFRLKSIALRPAPEGPEVAQDFDGAVTLAAKQATTFSRRMRFEPKEEKNCLGFWTDAADWAEWRFTLHEAGKFNVRLHHGCGPGNEGSEVEVWINDEKRTFTVADTGGFQSWKPVDQSRQQSQGRSAGPAEAGPRPAGLRPARKATSVEMVRGGVGLAPKPRTHKESPSSLNPLHPRADGDSVAAGSKKRFPISLTPEQVGLGTPQVL